MGITQSTHGSQNAATAVLQLLLLSVSPAAVSMPSGEANVQGSTDMAMLIIFSRGISTCPRMIIPPRRITSQRNSCQQLLSNKPKFLISMLSLVGRRQP